MTTMVHPLLVLRVLLLLGTANGTPIFAKKLLGDRFAWPIDGGWVLPDGRPLFGAAKTIRGVVVAIGFTTVFALLLGFGWEEGAGVAAAAMVGDLASSFLKRRLGLALHAQCTGLDQIPEALLPMLLFAAPLGLTLGDIGVALLLFVALEAVLSRMLFQLHVRDRPY